MKASIIYSVVALALLANCSAQTNQVEMPKSSYYEQVLRLLDPSNPVPLIAVSTNTDGYPQQVGDVKVGMTVADVISLWGKPRALWVTNAKYETLVYGNVSLRCRDGVLGSIEFVSTNFPVNLPATCTTNHVPVSVASNYCERLHNLFRTNASEHCPAILMTNSVVSIAELKDGIIGTLKLGMTMSDVVDVLGKPPYFCRFSTNRATLYYGYGLLFRGDCLVSIPVYVSNVCPQMRFDNGLTRTNSITSYIEALGTPLYSRSSGSWHKLSYKFGTTHLFLNFCSPYDDTAVGLKQGEAVLASLSLHYYGTQDMRNEADVKYVETVATILNLSPEKLKQLRKFDETDLPLLEKELGKPLTDEQRKGIVSALEIRSKKYDEADKADKL